MKCKYLLMVSLCVKFLKKLREALKNDVLAKHENKNHSGIDGFGADWVCDIDYSEDATE
jgi:hypothetical protein